MTTALPRACSGGGGDSSIRYWPEPATRRSETGRWSKWSLAILERATWSQTDREPRAPSKILRALFVVALVASFERGFASRERPVTQAIPKWPHAGSIYAA
jgi:hypothetical protein